MNSLSKQQHDDDNKENNNCLQSQISQSTVNDSTDGTILQAFQHQF